jgi:subtilisin
MRRILRCLVLSTLFSLAVPAARAQAPGDRVPDHYIVEVRPGANATAVAARHGVGPTFLYSRAVHGFAGKIPPGLLPRVQNDPQVVSVTPDRVVSAIQSASGRPSGGGGTTGEVVPAGVARIGAAPSNNLGFNGAGIGVAIVDTGIDLNHADLQANLGTVSYSAYGTVGQDDEGHGTHVAGIVAAIGGNSIGVVGVAPQAKLYAVKVLDGSGNGSDAVVTAGLDWVAANWNQVSPNIRVVNMSLGRAGSIDDNPSMRAAVQSLTSLGIAVVVAAGNDASLTISQQVPAAYPEVIAVASTTAKTGAQGKVAGRTYQVLADTASYFTTDGDPSAGTQVAISAPGEDKEDVKNGGLLASVGILSTALGGGTTRMSGTSMASPHVTGVAALVLSKNPTLSTEAVRSTIRGGASVIGTAPLNSPTSTYTFDGEREGVLSAPGALSQTLPAP